MNIFQWSVHLKRPFSERGTLPVPRTRLHTMMDIILLRAIRSWLLFPGRKEWLQSWNSAIFICIIILLLLLIIQELNLKFIAEKEPEVSCFGHWLRQMTRIKVPNVFFVRNRQTEHWPLYLMRRPLLLLIRQKAGKPRCVNIFPYRWNLVRWMLFRQAPRLFLPLRQRPIKRLSALRYWQPEIRLLFYWKKSPWIWKAPKIK